MPNAMNRTLIQFFRGEASLEELRAAVRIRVRHEEGTKRVYSGRPSGETLSISRTDLAILAEHLIAGRLSGDELADVSFWILAAAEIQWAKDDELIAEVLWEWASPDFEPSESALRTTHKQLLVKE